jgi:hypothetical protein
MAKQGVEVMLTAHVTPAPHHHYPADPGLPFHLRHEGNPEQTIPCECGGDQFVHGATIGDCFCTSCKGLVVDVADHKNEP